MRWVPVALGAAVLLWIIASIPRGVFFSVDGGTKLLGVRALLDTGYTPAFYLPERAWLAELWRGEAFPFRPPFAVPAESVPPGHPSWQLGFPLPFLALSAAPFALWGERALLLLPFASTLFVWLLVARRFAPHPAALLLVALSVGSFASLYGATFWEHPTALALVTWAVLPWPGGPASGARETLRGLVLAAAGFLRPEAWLLGAGWLGIRAHHAKAAKPASTPKEKRWVAIVAFSIGGLAFALHNQLLYGAPLGAHGSQLGQGVEAAAGTTGMSMVDVAVGLWTAAFTRSPTIVLLLLLGLSTRAMPTSRDGRVALLALGAFLLLSPAMLPNAGGRQWGPRYWIVGLPLAWTAIAAYLSPEPASGEPSAVAPGPAGTRAGRWLLLAAAAAGLAGNLAFGGSVFVRGYQRDTARLFDALEKLHADAVAITVPLQAGELAGRIDRWPYALARDTVALATMATRLPPEVQTLVWVVPAPGGPDGSSFDLPGPRPLRCQLQGWALAAHYLIRCELGTTPSSGGPDAAHSTGE